MSRMRSGLKPSVTSRHSPTKFPPVRTGWGANSPPLSSHTRDPEWSHDIVRGIQLKTVSKTPSAASNSPRRSSGKDEVKTPSPKQEEKAFFSSQQNGKDKEIEVSFNKFAGGSLYHVLLNIVTGICFDCKHFISHTIIMLYVENFNFSCDRN